MSNHHDFSGLWTVRHVYPGYLDNKEESTEFMVKATHKGADVVFESTSKEKDDYMLVRLKIDGILATGTWQEKTPSHGRYEGMEYSGAGQLLISDDGKSMQGMWAGIGLDRNNNKPKIYTGEWELKKL